MFGYYKPSKIEKELHEACKRSISMSEKLRDEHHPIQAAFFEGEAHGLITALVFVQSIPDFNGYQIRSINAQEKVKP